MTIIYSLIFLFVFAFVFSLVLTPLVGALGIKLGAMDIPMERKIHTKPIPRVGGVALFLVSGITIFLASAFSPPVSELFKSQPCNILSLCGMIAVFGCGLWDDFRRLSPLIKLLFQILGASLAFSGGAAISGFFVAGYGSSFGFFSSYVITVFWFLLFINAVNLIDGLDGLASGVVFFTCILMFFLLYINGDYVSAFYFCVLSGTLLGFLRYNFNPASIFLGDGGSYLLGYIVALLAIRSSMKSQVGILMLIPLLALGVPIFDTIFSPIRRWIIGRNMFDPDKGHIHHHLLKIGFSSRSAVLLIYGITMVLCIAAILIITLRGKGLEGFFLGVLLFGLLFLVSKLGYVEYLAFDKFYGWFQDITDVAGFTHSRRSFLNIQIEIEHAQNMEQIWENICRALELMRFDRGELYIYYSMDNTMSEPTSVAATDYDGMERRRVSVNGPNGGNEIRTARNENRQGIVRTWTLGHNRRHEDISYKKLFRVEIPLNAGETCMGMLVLMKDVVLNPLRPHTLRRVEYLRRSITAAMKEIKK